MALRNVIRAISAFLAVAVTTAAAEAKRVALVIGNQSYQVGPLTNPVNDAEAVAGALRRLGFDTVEVKRNLGAQAMKSALRDFSGDADGADMAVVYFAGHGTENSGTNYLIPVDARLARASDLELEAVRLDAVLGTLDGAKKLKLVILDACRNTIFPLSGSKRSQTRGLARVEPEDNTLVAYAAKEGTVADDGAGRKHSPFTQALLRHIETPGVEVDYIFRLVRDEVAAATSRQQIPHLYGTQGRERVYFKAPDAAEPSAADAELARLKAENEELRKQQQANLAPSPKPEAAPEPADPAPAPAASASELKPGKEFRDCSDCPTMVVVPAGTFMMGTSKEQGDALIAKFPSDDAQPDLFASEQPQHRVTIGKGFAVGKYEITLGLWDACIAAGGCTHRPDVEAAKHRRFPVVDISWHDAQAYVQWLSKKTGKSYRLLTEAEWEYAARAGTTTPWSFGDTITEDQAQWNGAFDLPVDWGPANAFGLHNTASNVMEWTEDCYIDGYDDAPDDGSARVMSTCAERVVRSGGWWQSAGALRSASRAKAAPDMRTKGIGLRVARSLE